jgi:hypothetical protein
MSDTVEALNDIWAAIDTTNGYLSLILQELREANKPKPRPVYTINNKLAGPVVIRQAAKA